LGDLDGDGVTDLAVGAVADDTGGNSRGAVHVLHLNATGTVKSSLKIASGTNGGPTLADDDYFGFSMASVGDLDGDGVADLGVGAALDDTGGMERGAMHMLLMNATGTVKSSIKIAHQLNGGPTLANLDYFGSAVARLDDLDGDGVTDLAVGAFGDDAGGTSRGAVHVLFLKALSGETLPGDYNQDGSVDAADYVVWRKTNGASVPSFSGADGNGDGVVDEHDRLLWRGNFGRTQAVAAAANLEGPHPLPKGEGVQGPLLATGSSPRRIFDLRPDGEGIEAARAFTATVARREYHPPARSGTLPISATSQDDALLAWLASRRETTGRTPQRIALSKLSDKVDVNTPIVFAEALDLAFESLVG
jgi:hypothetical protein